VERFHAGVCGLTVKGLVLFVSYDLLLLPSHFPE